MTFDLLTIGLLCTAALVYGLALPASWRSWALMIGSVVALYALQPRLPIRYSDYIFPTLTVVIAVAGWWFTRKPQDEAQQASIPQDRLTFGIAMALVVGMSLFRYIAADYRLTPSRPPNPLYVLVSLAVLIPALWAIAGPAYQRQRRSLTALILVIVGVFVLLKAEPLGTLISQGGRTLSGQDVSLASHIDLNWLGFSYVAFRLIHTFRDRQTGLLPVLSLREYLTYVIFFPAIIAGPIDRAEHFAAEYRKLPTLPIFDANRLTLGGTRIATGMLKKFVIADSLAAGAALNATNATQAESALWLWVLLYGYGLRLFFDFSGYTDIAIGIGILFGITLPENFQAPYLKTNITTFWQSWHITLSNWARFYVFTPLSRRLLSRKPPPSQTLIVISTQTATMVTIGLWHGITWNFLIWGLWHGLGLFVHKQWSDRTRKWHRNLKTKKWPFHLWTGFAWLLTFHFVTLGWVWFALPNVSDSLTVFVRLFGGQ